MDLIGLLREQARLADAKKAASEDVEEVEDDQSIANGSDAPANAPPDVGQREPPSDKR
jgi:hypothetical protein